MTTKLDHPGTPQQHQPTTMTPPPTPSHDRKAHPTPDLTHHTKPTMTTHTMLTTHRASMKEEEGGSHPLLTTTHGPTTSSITVATRKDTSNFLDKKEDGASSWTGRRGRRHGSTYLLALTT
eukprot:13611779-Heterocapsa_arctica.AAC.1